MNEATVSCIDSHVVDVATVDTEEHQIARRQCVLWHRPRRGLLRIRRSWNLDPRSARVDIDGEAAAIKSLQIRPTEVIRRPDQRCSGTRDGKSAVPWRLQLSRWRSTTASNEQQRQNNRDNIAQAPNLTRPPCRGRRNPLFSSQRGCRSSAEFR
jgi:hypothetical protein